MKKILIMFGALLVTGALHAAIPLDQNPQANQEAYYDTPLLGNSTGFLTIAAPTAKIVGSTSYNGKNCLTRLIVQMTTSATFYLLDGNTTAYILYGQAFGATGPNTLNIAQQHLEPICATSGNAMTLNMTPASTGVNVANYEGYIWYPAGNSAR